MHDLGAAADGKEAPAPSFSQLVSSLGPLRFALFFALAFGSSVWLVKGALNVLWWTPPGLVNEDGEHIGRDFVAFFSAAHLALGGAPASPSDPALIHDAELHTIGAQVAFTPWFYPPFVQELLAPLAMLPYVVALALWLLVPLIGLLLLARRFVPHWSAYGATVLFPGTTQCLLIGQNGILSTLIIGAGLSQLERKPILAGAILGALSYKPHIAATVYAALLFGGYWRSLAAAFLIAAALAGTSVVAFGLDPWIAFLRESHFARSALERGELPWNLMTTVFAGARSAGADAYMSYALQAGVAFAAFAALFAVWRREGPLGPRAAILCAMIPLTTPYAYNYDLVVLLIPMFWLVHSGLQTGFTRSELVALTLTWMIPPVGWLIAQSWHVLFTPIILILFAAILLRRILAGENAVIEKPVQLFHPQLFALHGTTSRSRA